MRQLGRGKLYRICGLGASVRSAEIITLTDMGGSVVFLLGVGWTELVFTPEGGWMTNG
jgi:hypothetical protein